MKQECKKCKANFILDSDDLGFYEKMKVPSPKVCPDCRFKMRAMFRNETTLYSGRKCALCGKSVISMYNPKSPYIVYCNACYLGDKWNPLDYGQVYEKSKSFFSQLDELAKKVPKAATYSSPALGPNINSDYANFSGGNKDGYLIFNSGPDNENCAYSRGLTNNRDAFDIYLAHGNERIYDSVNAQKNSNVSFTKNAIECIDSQFVLDCVACQNCFGCVNLRYKSYNFFNEQLSREEYLARVNEILGSYAKTEEAKEKFNTHSLKFPRKENNNFKTTDSVGDYLIESKNCQNCFEAAFSENVKNSFSVKFAKDSYDLIGHGRQAELILEGVGVGLGQRVIGSWWVENSHDVEYSLATRSSEYCMGCDGVKNVKYCILNKIYSGAEYKDLREHIIKELNTIEQYGLFLPPEISLFAYNETIAQDNFPLTKEEAIAQGFRWEDDIQKTEGKETLQPEEIPDHIKDVHDSITAEILKCVDCNRNYKITKQELAFYKKMSIPIPRMCFYCRHQDRIVRRGPYKFWDRHCAKCDKAISTNYAPDRPEIVYCEDCYKQEVY